VSRTADGVTITDAALTQIVVGAAEQVDGARVRKRGVELEEDSVAISLAARYGVVLSDLARDVQQRVAEALATMCDLNMRVDISLDEIDE
jgi:uncharacterized alkaline shock family protein YloU